MANNLRNAVAKMCSGVVVVIEFCRVRLLGVVVFLALQDSPALPSGGGKYANQESETILQRKWFATTPAFAPTGRGGGEAGNDNDSFFANHFVWG